MIVNVLLSALLSQPQPPSAMRYYVEALKTTEAVTQPKAATYAEYLASSGMKFELLPVDGKMEFAVGYGKDFVNSMNLNGTYVAGEGVRIERATKALPATQPIFNPTWSGVALWMKHGFDFGQDPAPVATPAPASATTPSPLKIITTVTAVDPGAYRISDGGPAPCANGEPGHRLLLRALSDPQTHPLTSVVVDTRSMRFCTMQFRYGSPSALSLTADFQLHLGAIGDYWMVTDGTIDVQARALGVRALHSHIAFRYDDFAFPAADSSSDASSSSS